MAEESKPRIKPGKLKPRDPKAHRITQDDIEDAKAWTAKLSQPGTAPVSGGKRVTIRPKMARLFWK